MKKARFTIFTLLAALALAAVALPAATYQDLVQKSQPVAWWRLNDSGSVILNHAPGPDAAVLNGAIAGRVDLKQPGPDNEQFPEFEPDSTAAAFAGRGGHIIVKDPGANSPLDFAKGDSITLEAWVFLNDIGGGQNIYVIGKGRTGNKGFAADNQNWALRLREQKGQACLSFLFRGEANRSGDDWHRWTTKTGFVPNSGWHHIAVTYTFGKGDSVRGYIDGAEIKGDWDMGGKTDAAPVVDDDEVWIGSSLGGHPNTSFNGLINEVALYRRALAAKDMKERYKFVPVGPKFSTKDLPKDAVRVEIIERIPADNSWNFVAGKPAQTFTVPAFAFAQLPQKYNHRGVRADRSNPFLVRAAGSVTLPKGEHRLLLRSLQGARLFMDGQLLAVTPFIKGSGDGHGEVPPIPTDLPVGLRFARMGHNDEYVTIQSDGRPHVFVLEAMIGGPKGMRQEIGEISVSVELDTRSLVASAGSHQHPSPALRAPSPLVGRGERDGVRGAAATEPKKLFFLLSPTTPIPHTDEGWETYVESESGRLAAMDAQNRRELAAEEIKYWSMRHELARKLAGETPAPSVPRAASGLPVHNDIDRFIGARLQAADVKPAPLTDDYAFLRRVALDTTGVPPSPGQIREFMNDRSADRRARAIDRFLASPAWADHWVSYWQDVLAENPGILKPTLNNTGPFRWWIHESFLDNKPMDRFVTELIRMDGSVYGGGPAGFGLATQNDAPMADRAQIVSQAFLAMNLACARCHDAPYHDFKQKDLFSLAAMLKQGPQEVPKSSSIPVEANITIGRLVNVTLQPGEKVTPAWPFGKVAGDAFSESVLRDANDSRERLAAFLTDPRNERFTRVLVNRIWQRYLGWGIVEPVDDWETSKPSHPGLLDWLARELVTHNYDLKHVARLILNSHAYQRQAGFHEPASDKPEDRLFASPQRRRLTAEQLVDSLFAVVGKDMQCELLTLDNDGRRAPKDFLNLGYPKRAWEFVSLSNDRDRPALSMPRTQEVVDMLAMFGWRETRQNPLSVRDESPNVLQPASIANGGLSNGRAARLTDDGAVTDLCVQSQPLEKLVERVFLHVLSRPPTAGESAAVKAHLERGYAERVKPAPAKSLKKEFDPSLLLSWSNHLNAKATDIKLAVEEKARWGDAPTARLENDWRERMEDALWALLNTPEFVFVP
jgi:hypothetical protein